MAFQLLNTLRNKIFQQNKKYLYLAVGTFIGYNVPTKLEIQQQLQQLQIQPPLLEILENKTKYFNFIDNKNIEHYIPPSIQEIYKCWADNDTICIYSFTAKIFNNDIVNETMKNKLIELMHLDKNKTIESKLFVMILKRYISIIVSDEVKSYIRINGNEIDKEKLVNKINDKLCKFNYQIKLYDFNISFKKKCDFYKN